MAQRRASSAAPRSGPFTAAGAAGDEWVLDEAGPAPCRVSCPAGVDAKAYVGLIAAGRFREALEAVKRKNPLPGICGRVCTHPCEDECARGDVDEPVAICALKRFAADWEVERVERVPPADRPRLRREVAVVGAGPAGLTAASNLARQGVGVTVFDRLDRAGGMLVSGIPAYRLPRDVIEREVAAIEDLGVDFRLGVEVGSEGNTVSDLLAGGFRAVFLATGAWAETRLAVEGEEAEGVLGCLDFLRRVNLGEGARLRGRVLVVGGGNSALDAARTALRSGAESVTVVYRRTRTEMPAAEEEVEEAGEEGVRFEFLASPLRIRTDGAGRMTGAEFQRMELGPPDESGRRRPVPVPGASFPLEADFLVRAVGQRPDLGFLERGAPAALAATRWNTLEADGETGATAHPGVFAGGDLVSGAATVIEAIEGGHRASRGLLRFLRGREETDLVFRPDRELEIRPQAPRVAEEPRRRHGRAPARRRARTFEEVARALTEEEAVAEARRCLRCGACAECFECIPQCGKRLAVVEDETLVGGGSAIVRVETAAGAHPFDGTPARFRGADGAEIEAEVRLLLARVDEALCRGCGECERACPYEAVAVADGRARVDAALCKGCGLCAGACPTGAISAPGFSDAELLARLARNRSR